MANSATAPSPRFWDRHADRYAKRPVSTPEDLEHKLDMIRERLTPEMRVLELGCGTGTTALKLAPLVQSYAATDLSPKMIEICTRKLTESPTPGLSFSCESVEAYQGPEGGFDAVLGMALLHLLQDRRAAMRKVRLLLKPGGYFFSNTACLRDMKTGFKYLIPLMRLIGLAPPLRSFSAETLIADLKAEGFEIEAQWRGDGKTATQFVVARRPV